VGAPQRDELSVYPNPVVSNATIRFATTSGSAGPARVRIFDAAGREVRTFEGFASGAASQTVSWDGRSASGAGVVPGVYFVRLEAGDRSQAARVVRIR
jgi:flagellar hook assembly protein FlgD